MDLESQELVSLVSLMFGAIEKVVFGNGSCDFECSKIPLINFQLMNYINNDFHSKLVRY